MDKTDIQEHPLEPERVKEEQQETEAPQESKEQQGMDRSFENALSSAIEKKQMEKQKEDTAKKEMIDNKKELKINKEKIESKQELTPIIEEEKPVEKTLPELQVVPTDPEPEAIVEETSERQSETEEKQESDKKTIGIKCPECNHKFSFVLGEDVTKIKCPNCGKEGILE